jgi:hypothetical protein
MTAPDARPEGPVERHLETSIMVTSRPAAAAGRGDLGPMNPAPRPRHRAGQLVEAARSAEAVVERAQDVACPRASARPAAIGAAAPVAMTRPS